MPLIIVLTKLTFVFPAQSVSQQRQVIEGKAVPPHRAVDHSFIIQKLLTNCRYEQQRGLNCKERAFGLDMKSSSCQKQTKCHFIITILKSTYICIHCLLMQLSQSTALSKCSTSNAPKWK